MSRSSTVERAPSLPQSPRTTEFEKDKAAAPPAAKPGLRSRLFGLKTTKAPSASSSSLEAPRPSSSPKLAAFPPSLYSQNSRSSLNQSEFADDRDRGRDSASLHSRDTETDQDEHYLGRPRSATQGSRKSSTTSDFLRKSIRFKDKSGLLKARGSQSSAPGSPISPASPLPAFEPRSSYDQGELPPKQPYKQISGRRGPQYYDVPDVNPDGQLRDASRSEASTASPVKQRPLSYAGPALSTSNSYRLSSEQLPSRESPRRLPTRLDLEKRKSTTSIQGIGSPTASPGGQVYVPRSSSLRGISREARQMLEAEEASYGPNAEVLSVATRRSHLRSPSSPLSSTTTLPRSPGLISPTAPDSPYRSVARASRREGAPERADSVSSPRTMANAIPEEGAGYAAPMPSLRVEEAVPSTATARPAETSGETAKPGLPPKNPLRKKRPSAPVSSSPISTDIPQQPMQPQSPRRSQSELAPSHFDERTAKLALPQPTSATLPITRSEQTRSSTDTAPRAGSTSGGEQRPPSASTLDRPSTASSTASSSLVAHPRDPSFESDTAYGGRKKKDVNGGNRILAFARELGQRDAEAEGLSSFRLGRGSKSKKEVVRTAYGSEDPGAAEAPSDDSQVELSLGQSSTPSHTRSSLNNGRGASGMHLTADDALRLSSQTDTYGSSSSVDPMARIPISPRTIPKGLELQRPLLYRQPSSAKVSWTIAQDSLNDNQKRLVRRWFILRELLETERTYASDLAVARDIYLARAKAGAGPVSPRTPLGMRSNSIFSQLTSSDQQNSTKAQPRNAQGSSSSRTSTPLIAPRPLFRNASAELSPNHLPNGSSATSQATNSVASLGSSNPSNRSSMYTVSSQSSQTSDAAHFLLASNPPKVPTIPNHLLADNQGSLRQMPGSPVSPTSPFTPVMTPMASTQTVSTAGLTPGSDWGANPDAPFTASDVRIVFAHLESCAALADEMVAVLEDAVGHICNSTTEDLNKLLSAGLVQEKTETDHVGLAFLRLMPRIEQVYSAYCSRHEASMTRLQDLIATQPKVVMFMQECTQVARAHTNAWDLASLLIKPVQRVLKYPLLLAEILSATTSQHPDIENLRAASTEIQKVADYINEVKKRKDLVDQIVSGKTGKRTTSQKVQHGTTKKLLRRQEKVKNLMLGPSEDILADGGQYKVQIALLKRLEKGLLLFSRSCTAWSSGVKETHSTQLRLLDQWRRVYALSEAHTNTGAEERVRALMALIETQFMTEYWTQLDREIRGSLLPAVQRIALMFAHPHSVIAKRDERELDYTRYRAEMAKSGNKSSDKKTTESAAAFVALHSQLMDEIPQFNYGVQTLLDICIESLSRTQATYYLRIHRSLIDFGIKHASGDDVARGDELATQHANANANTVKVFWDVHRSVADYAEGLGIVSGPHRNRSMSASLDNQLSPSIPSTPNTTHFSPLQSLRDLPDPDFTSAVPSTQMLTRRVDALTAPSVDDLMTPPSLLEVSPLVTPPLGSRGGSPFMQSDSQLGSPAQIGTPLPQTTTTRAASKSGGLIGLLRSVGSNAALSSSSRKASHSGDTMYSVNSTFDTTPPTPLSKDSVSQAATQAEAADAPTLPALSFNSGFFAQTGTEFLEPAQGLGVTTPGGMPSGLAAHEPEHRASDKIMAAVANSPAVRPQQQRNGSQFVAYKVGDLIRVVGQDERFLFGTTEHGDTGWVERENFALLP